MKLPIIIWILFGIAFYFLLLLIIIARELRKNIKKENKWKKFRLEKKKEGKIIIR